MYQKVLDAPSENWPVFPSFHRPTLSERLTDGLTAREYTETETEEIHADRSQVEACVEFDITPPSMTTDADDTSSSGCVMGRVSNSATTTTI